MELIIQGNIKAFSSFWGGSFVVSFKLIASENAGRDGQAAALLRFSRKSQIEVHARE